jgi:hypothetical protein
MDGAGDEGTVAARVAHPIQILAGQDAASRKKADTREAPAHCFHQAEIHSAARSDATEIQQQERRHTGVRRLSGQRQGIWGGSVGILHGGVENRIPESEVQAENHARRADDTHDGHQIGEGA